jgi:pimeloyl-ACP methyl ester carboxylesterase
MTDLPPYPAPMPAPRRLSINGISMAVFEEGEGPPVVLCHGFPELAWSWRHQIPALAAAGYHVIAPDQRGYGLTDAPKKVEAYDIHHLTGDLVGLLDSYGYEKAVFVGHDWGGIVVWQMALLHPDRTAGVIALNTPFMPRLSDDPIKLMRLVYGDDMYIVHFQKPGVADAQLARDVGKTFRFFMRRSDITPEEFSKRPAAEKSLALAKALETPEAHWNGKPLLSDEDMDVFVRTYERTGFTGGINWYRNFTRNWETTAHVEQKVTCPSLMIMAARDVVLPPSMCDGMEKYVPDLEKYLVEDSGHWTQQEQPAEVNRVMIDWLNRRYGKVRPR